MEDKKIVDQLTRIADALEHIAGTDKKSSIDDMTEEDVKNWFNNPESGLLPKEFYDEKNSK